jgi:hypothetical protein
MQPIRCDPGALNHMLTVTTWRSSVRLDAGGGSPDDINWLIGRLPASYQRLLDGAGLPLGGACERLAG